MNLVEAVILTQHGTRICRVSGGDVYHKEHMVRGHGDEWTILADDNNKPAELSYDDYIALDWITEEQRKRMNRTAVDVEIERLEGEISALKARK